MELIADLHVHSLASEHALSTVGELIAQARQMGYRALVITDHARNMLAAPTRYYFTNLLRQPDVLEDGFLLLKGIEANIMDKQGTIDAEEDQLPQFDWVVASIHGMVMDEPFAPGEDTTAMWLRLAENPYVDMIGHSEQQNQRYDYDAVTKVFAQKNKVVELNAGSAAASPGNEDNLRQLALCCKKNGAKVAVNSDAHSVFQMPVVGTVLAMLRDIDFPPELVVNASMRQLHAELKQHNKPIAGRLGL